MKQSAIAAALFCIGATTALAQGTDIPRHSCEPKPAYPGLKAMRSDVEVKAFEASMKAYKECIIAYISQRKSSIKAHEAAESTAAKEYNETMAKIRADQEAQRAEAEKARQAAEKNEPATPSAPKGKY